MSWRLLTDWNVPHDRGLAQDDALTRSATEESSPTLRLYTYSPCVLVGRFQRVPNEVKLENCEAAGVPVNRRPSGGGAIIMGPDQLGIALVIPSHAEGFAARSSELMNQCASGLINALQSLGIAAKFAGKNDLVTRARKIAGLGLYQPNSGGRLFHASLLLDLNVRTMLKLLRTPFDSSDIHTESCVARRITTIRSEFDSSLTMPELMGTVKAGYQDEFGIGIESGEPTAAEQDLADELAADQYSKRDWIFGNDAVIRDRIGRHSLRTEAGDIDVRVIVAGETVKSVYVSGNFIASENAIHDLESSLRWHVRDPGRLKETVVQSMTRNDAAWDRISADQITAALLQALSDTGSRVEDLTAGACFAREPAQIAAHPVTAE